MGKCPIFNSLFWENRFIFFFFNSLWYHCVSIFADVIKTFQ